MILLNAHQKNDHKFVELPSFELKNIDGRLIKSSDVAGENGLLIAFICNHCPYVKAIARNIADDAESLRKIGIETIAINSNDEKEYPEDSFEKMIDFALQNKFNFPYLVDSTQDIAKKFDAVCTPDFFLFTKQNDKLVLSHKGRLNNFVYSKTNIQIPENFNLQHELLIIAEYLVGKSKSSIGCSIKWKVCE